MPLIAACPLSLSFASQLDRSAALSLDSCYVVWPQDTDSHGLTFKVRGFKPEGTAPISSCYCNQWY
jgi:hypothetical protein